MTLEEKKVAKRQEIAQAGEEAYWAAWTMEGVSPVMAKDFILSIAPQLGIALSQAQRDMRVAARDVIVKNRNLLIQVRDAQTETEVEGISWTP
jgi:hypothetical protein